MSNEAAERLLAEIGKLSLRSEGNPLDWTAQHRLWWEQKVDAALAEAIGSFTERMKVALAEAKALRPDKKGRMDYIDFLAILNALTAILDAELSASVTIADHEHQWVPWYNVWFGPDYVPGDKEFSNGRGCLICGIPELAVDV